MVDMEHKIQMFIFIIGSLMAVLSSSFIVRQEFAFEWDLFLMIIGLVLAVMNVGEEQEEEFVLYGTAFVLLTWFSEPYLEKYLLLQNVAGVMRNFSLMALPVIAWISFKHIVEIVSVRPKDVPPQKTAEYSILRNSAFGKLWNYVLVVAVSAVFVLLALEVFFRVDEGSSAILGAAYIINGIFILDLIFLYLDKKSIRRLLSENWADIIAVVPVSSLFFIAKLSRLARIFRIARISKVGKVSSGAMGAKFFSKDSGFNEALSEKNRRRKH